MAHRVKEPKRFGSYIHKVLVQVHPDIGINGKALKVMDGIVHHILEKHGRVISKIMGGRKTVTAREVQTAVRLSLPSELAKHAVSEGTKHTTLFNAASTQHKGHGSAKGERRSLAFLAGLQFPVARVSQQLMNSVAGATRKGRNAGVYMAAVVQYLVAEVLELAGNTVKERKLKRIIPRHIFLVIANDEELLKLFGTNSVVPYGGVLPNIHAALLKTSTKKSSEEKE